MVVVERDDGHHMVFRGTSKNSVYAFAGTKNEKKNPTFPQVQYPSILVRNYAEDTWVCIPTDRNWLLSMAIGAIGFTSYKPPYNYEAIPRALDAQVHITRYIQVASYPKKLQPKLVAPPHRSKGVVV